jgi:uncharacterized membrane protein
MRNKSTNYSHLYWAKDSKVRSWMLTTKKQEQRYLSSTMASEYLDSISVITLPGPNLKTVFFNHYDQVWSALLHATRRAYHSQRIPDHAGHTMRRRYPSSVLVLSRNKGRCTTFQHTVCGIQRLLCTLLQPGLWRGAV